MQIALEHERVSSATSCDELADLKRKYLVQVGSGSNAARLQRVKAQLRRALPTLGAQAAAQHATQAAPQLPPLPPPAQPQSSPSPVAKALQPPASSAHRVAAPQRSHDADTTALSAMRIQLELAQLDNSELKGRVAALQEHISQIREPTARDSGHDAPQPAHRVQPELPCAPQFCDVAMVFQGVPGVVAGMGTCAAQARIAEVLSNTLQIPDVQVRSYTIMRVSKSDVQKPVVLVQVHERTLLSSIFANKTAARMGRSCPVHIFISQPPGIRPGAASTMQQRRRSRRDNKAQAEHIPADPAAAAAVAAAAKAAAAAAAAAATAASAATDAAMAATAAAAAAIALSGMGRTAADTAHSASPAQPTDPHPALLPSTPSSLSATEPAFLPAASPIALEAAFASVAAEPRCRVKYTALAPQDASLPLSPPAQPVVPEPPPAC